MKKIQSMQTYNLAIKCFQKTLYKAKAVKNASRCIAIKTFPSVIPNFFFRDLNLNRRGVFIINFDHILHLVLVFLLLTMSR